MVRKNVHVEPILLDIDKATEVLGVGRTKIYDLINDEELEVVRIGRAVRIPVASIRNYVERLREDQNL